MNTTRSPRPKSSATPSGLPRPTTGKQGRISRQKSTPWAEDLRHLNPDHEGPGLFVTFEGIDGTGKTTQANLVAKALRAHGHEIVVTCEPGGTLLGRQIRHMLLSFKEKATVLPRTEALLFAADRAEHVDEIIRPALKRGAIVLCDRYIDSSLAYQGAGRDLTVSQVDWLSAWATQGLWPDRTYLLDMSPEAAHRRIQRTRGGSQDRLDSVSLAFQTKTRQQYLRLAKDDPKRCLILDATQPIDAITRKILTDLGHLLHENLTTPGQQSERATREASPSSPANSQAPSRIRSHK